jgi:hypothetical protein
VFARAVPALVAVWALGGFYLSLGPNLAAQLSRSHNLMWGGAVAFLLTGVGAATALAVRNVRPATVMLGGCLALMVGTGVSVAAIETGSAAVLLLSTGLAGLGFGPAFLGAYRTVVALAAPADRAGLIAAIFSVNYLSMGLPALIAGIVDTGGPAWHRVGLLRGGRRACRSRREHLLVQGQFPHRRTAASTATGRGGRDRHHGPLDQKDSDRTDGAFPQAARFSVS